MPEEERTRLKEKYLKELRERKQFRRRIASVRKTQAIHRALGEMVDTLADTTETGDAFTSKLDAETALNEARLEIALESETPEAKVPVPDPKSPPQPPSPPVKTIGPRLKANPPDEDA